MTEEVKKKLKNVLANVYNCVLAEEDGSAEHISEWVSSDEIDELCTELGFDVS